MFSPEISDFKDIILPVSQPFSLLGGNRESGDPLCPVEDLNELNNPFKAIPLERWPKNVLPTRFKGNDFCLAPCSTFWDV